MPFELFFSFFSERAFEWGNGDGGGGGGEGCGDSLRRVSAAFSVTCCLHPPVPSRADHSPGQGNGQPSTGSHHPLNVRKPCMGVCCVPVRVSLLLFVCVAEVRRER